jgi:acyl carrier protein
MTRDDMLRQIEKIIETAPNSLSGNEKLSDLASWDSLAILGYIAAVDKSCGIRLKADQLYSCNTVNDLLTIAKL